MNKCILSIVVLAIILSVYEPVKAFPEKPIETTSKNGWSEEFDVVEIASHSDGYVHKAYFYPSKSKTPKPLVVSLHTWSGDYRQSDPIANLSLAKDLNYIHPDFRGQTEQRMPVAAVWRCRISTRQLLTQSKTGMLTKIKFM